MVPLLKRVYKSDSSAPLDRVIAAVIASVVALQSNDSMRAMSRIGSVLSLASSLRAAGMQQPQRVYVWQTEGWRPTGDIQFVLAADVMAHFREIAQVPAQDVRGPLFRELCAAGISGRQHADMLADLEQYAQTEEVRPTRFGSQCDGPGCGRSAAEGTLRTCQRCKCAAYCSRRCQRAHWVAHKPYCAKPGTILQGDVVDIAGNGASGAGGAAGVRGLCSPWFAAERRAPGKWLVARMLMGPDWQIECEFQVVAEGCLDAITEHRWSLSRIVAQCSTTLGSTREMIGRVLPQCHGERGRFKLCKL